VSSINFNLINFDSIKSEIFKMSSDARMIGNVWVGGCHDTLIKLIDAF